MRGMILAKPPPAVLGGAMRGAAGQSKARALRGKRPETTMKRYETLEEFLADCMTADDAIRAAFDDPNPDDKGTYHPVCCGQETKCSGGIVGTDCAKCETCGAEIIMVLSPHVSPILLGRNCTHMPSKELWDKVGDRQWFVVQKSASKLVATA